MGDELQPPGGGALERLLLDASVDPVLAEELRQNPLAAAEDHGARLSSTELALLESMEPARLETILEAMAASGVQPPEEPIVDEVTFGIREGPPPERMVAAAGIRVEPPRELDIMVTGIRSDRPGPSMGIRPGRKVAIAVATVAVIGSAATAVFVTSAGSRPRRPATTAPQSTPDADVPDGGADGAAEKAPHPRGADPKDRTPK